VEFDGVEVVVDRMSVPYDRQPERPELLRLRGLLLLSPRRGDRGPMSARPRPVVTGPSGPGSGGSCHSSLIPQARHPF
jgi:hypothetical protein